MNDTAQTTAAATEAEVTTTAPAKKAAKKQNPDVRAFTGYIACDGSTHKTAAEAIKHSESVKVKAALDEIAVKVAATAGAAESLVSDDGMVAVEDLPKLLQAYRVDITAAFSQTVKMRAPRGSKKAAAGTQTAVGPVESA